MFLDDLVRSSNRKISVHECLTWVSQTALKIIKGIERLLGMTLEIMSLWCGKTQKNLLFKVVTEDSAWMCIKIIPNSGPIFLKNLSMTFWVFRIFSSMSPLQLSTSMAMSEGFSQIFCSPDFEPWDTLTSKPSKIIKCRSAPLNEVVEYDYVYKSE